MVEFNHPYRPPTQSESRASIEEPIFPMHEVGQTIPNIDQTGRHKSVVDVAQAAIRGGSGALQIVMMQVPGASGTGAHRHGTEVREALREVIRHNEVTGVGVELPTNLTNVTGFHGNQINEEIRKNNLDEIRSAIQFVGDVFEGGGTDVVSWEFDRRFFDAKWNTEVGPGKRLFELHPDEGQTGAVRFVDRRTGQVLPIEVSKGAYLKEDPKTGEPTDSLQKWEWQDFLNNSKSPEEAHELFKQKVFQNQLEIATAEASRRRRSVEELMEQEHYDHYKKKYDEDPNSVPEKKRKVIEYIQDQLSYIETQERTKKEQEEQIESLRPLSEYAKEKAIESYAELGLFALEEEWNRGPENLKEHLYVGPEIGWPKYYGGHPDEFIELITEARKKLAHKLKSEGLHGKKYSEKEAQETAKNHIKGTFDTGHVGMWLKHFRPDLPYRERLDVFNKWYLEQVEKIAKADVVGNVQLVDAMAGEHGHLPPGQGIFPLKEAMQIMKKHSSSPFHIVSEGHEEEGIEEGRIRTQTWRLLDSPVSRAYGSPSWGQIEGAYQSQVTSPKQMFGSYTPPHGEYKPWNDIPFE